MHLSDSGRALLKRSEGLRTTVYLDVVGAATVGYGHKLLPGESYPSGITADFADRLLDRDVLVAENQVAKLVRVELTQGQFDALVDFTFNLGGGNLAQSTLLKLLNAGQYDAAALELLKWDHAGHKELAALTTRRRAEYKLFTGHDASEGCA